MTNTGRQIGKERAWRYWWMSLLVLIVLLLGISLTAASLVGMGDELLERQQQLDLIRLHADKLRNRLTEHQAVAASLDPHLSGESETIAAAGFQQLALLSIAETNAMVQSVEIVQSNASNPAKENGHEIRIDLLVVMDAAITDVQRCLFAFETHVPYIWVDTLKMQPRRSTGLSDTANRGVMLRVELSLHGLWIGTGGGR